MDTSALVQRLKDRVRIGGPQPTAQLIVDEVWLAVVEGSIETGERLPTTRQLAITLGVSPRSIERAYAELERRGVVATRQGAGTFISLTQPSEEERERHHQLAQLCHDAVHRATALGFGIDDLLDGLAEYRTTSAETSTKEHGP